MSKPARAFRPSTAALGGLVMLLLLFVAMLGHAGLAPAPGRSAGLAAALGATDLALFTEARYTRHPSQADLHSAFQDHPFAFEHFPSGTLLAPAPEYSGALRFEAAKEPF